MKNLEGKVGIVTGARRGIGRAAALTLGPAGASGVVSAVRVDAECESLERQSTALGVDCLSMRSDVTVKEDSDAVVAAASDRLGRVDILINNARAGLTPVPWEDVS